MISMNRVSIFSYRFFLFLIFFLFQYVAAEKLPLSLVYSIVSENYSSDDTFSIELVSENENEIYLIKEKENSYVFRVLAPNRFWLKEPESHLFEAEWLTFLKERGLPISYPIVRNNGEFVGSVDTVDGVRFWALFSFAPGDAEMTLNRAWAFGHSIAEIHLASNEFQSSYNRYQADLIFLIDDSLKRIERFLDGRHPADLALLKERASITKEQLASLPFSGDEWGIIGGDFHGANQHFTDDEHLVHFDFEDCGYGWRSYDLAVFYWSNGSEDEIWDRFLEGYQSVRPLSSHELEAIPLFAFCRHIYWLGFISEIPGERESLEKHWDQLFSW